MTKRFKIFILVLLITLVTGCSGNYNLTINEDLSIDEELQLDIDNNSDTYNNTLKIFQENNVDKEKYEVKIVGNNIKLEYKDKFLSIEDYLTNSKIYHQIFNNISYNKTDDFIDLYVDESIDLKNNYTNLNGSNINDFEFIQLNITNPFNINFTNAEFVNNNVYTWTIKNTTENQKIQMQFNMKLNVFPLKGVIVGSTILLCTLIFLIVFITRLKRRQRI